jgi:hypothetical protein
MSFHPLWSAHAAAPGAEGAGAGAALELVHVAPNLIGVYVAPALAAGGAPRGSWRAARSTAGTLVDVTPPPPRTKWTRRVPHPVLIGHAASLSQVTFQFHQPREQWALMLACLALLGGMLAALRPLSALRALYGAGEAGARGGRGRKDD